MVMKYVTRYAFHGSYGAGGTIKREDVEHYGACYRNKDSWVTYMPWECHDTLEQAMAYAEEKRQHKINHLQESLKRLQAMTFRVREDD